MKLQTLSAFDTLPYFTIEAVKQLLGEEPVSVGTIQTALYRWMKAGQIIQLKKGVYMTRHFLELHRSDIDFAPMVSAILIPQSYLSLEYVLQRYDILTDVTYPISAITLKQTRVFENHLGTFTFRNIKSNLYTGFTISHYLSIPFAQASVSKALFDFFYFRSFKNIGYSIHIDLAEELRLNLEDFSEKDQSDFTAFVELSKSRKMDRILKNLKVSVWRH